MSYGICDLILTTGETIVLLEMQNKNLFHIEARICMYIASIYLEYWEDNDYSNIKPVEVCLILNYSYGEEKTLKEYQALEVFLKERFGKYINIQVWNLREAMKENNTINFKYAKLFCLKEYSVRQAEKILKELSKDKKFKLIVQKIREYNMSKKDYRKMKEREKMEMTFEQATSGLIAHAKEEGKIEGRMEGKIEGRMEEKIEMIHNLLSSGVDLDIIASAANLSKQQIIEYQSL